MSRAIELAQLGLYSTDPNPRVGCVIVKNKQIIGEGAHLKAGEPHAEVYALREAGDQARGATAYVTLEPCSHHGRTPPCADALIAAGVTNVIVAMADPNPQVAGRGFEMLRAAGIDVISGICEAESRELNPGFIKRMENGLPFVRLKIGASLDGKTAMASGESQWITSPQARQDVQHWRARSSVILTGIDTVLADDPSLNVRDENIQTHDRQPLRVVLDSALRFPQQAKLSQLPGEYLIMTCQESHHANVIQLPANDSDRIDLESAMRELAMREVNEVLVEAGATLSGALIQAGLVDELIVYFAPKLLGSAARSMLELPGLDQLADHITVTIKQVDQIGPDIRLIAVIR